MNIFISGTDTGVGKTLISSWLVVQTGFAYFKPIQTGTKESCDSEEVKRLTKATIYPECYTYAAPVSPHLAAAMENIPINLQTIKLPCEQGLIIEGAGGVLVPINEQHFMVDLIKHLNTPVILVTRTGLGTINHTLLSIETLRARHIGILGVIMNGEPNKNNKEAIEFYGKTTVIAEFPKLDKVDYYTLKTIPFCGMHFLK